jgi:transcriptional regulator with XRE-family HTH domain
MADDRRFIWTWAMPQRRQPSTAAVQLGRRIAARRALLGWSREKVAEAAGTSANYVGSIERGDQDAGLLTILRLAQALDTTPGELLDGLDPGSN